MHKFLLLFLTFGLALHAEMVGGVSIIVKDKAITAYEIKQEMRETQANVEAAASSLIRQKLEEIEIGERKISVSSSEVYDDIKETAKRNNMTVQEFYSAALDARGINSEAVKEKVKQKLLTTKLYSAIAYSKLKTPSDKDVEEYYELNKATFNHPSSFDVTIYQSQDKNALAGKIQNPMLYTPHIQEIQQTLPYERIAPELAQLLAQTSVHSFTPIIPDGKGGHMTLYVSEVADIQEKSLEDIKYQVQNAMLAEKRENVLKDYFTRLRDNTEIKVLREPK